ncbi:hypothetical protein [Halodesulfovibrio sp.]|jgi:hypothetical protein|uniref:hypothetical protein n=1 Tax=Halodesulfovibrio sp. TaxID=1912772 RepID=UPI0025EEAF4F|nr:hypothetical protein [Halodesulfovibrio sp.]MCT4536299.1 hypothetical protein [Halodesulfovibrio sp.]
MIVRRASVEDAVSLQGRLRKADYDEVWAAHGHNPDEVLVACALYSTKLWCAEVDDAVAAVFGVAPSPYVEGEGQPWMLGSDVITAVPRAFVQCPLEIIPQMQKLFPVLRNMVDARNTKSIRWLERMGFCITQETVPHGPFGMPFYEFCKEEELCVL